jgi:TetR/AcrR family transcriptional regulator, transcriptional repressor for nem operon
MADSATIAGGKRQQLVDSAKSLFYEQGVHRTTLADVAERAGVPLGNVYYYFKSKEALVQAVLESRAAEIDDALEGFAQKRTPQARLKALARGWVDIADMVSRSGCPLGSLCSELGKTDPESASETANLFEPVVDWIELQFRELGRRGARDFAFDLLARVQGAALLAQSFRDPDVLVREARRIDRWIDNPS